MAKGAWLGDAFVELRVWLDGDGDALFGETAVEQPADLGTDPDFHQRLIGRVEGDRILAHPDISHDRGVTWVKDFDMTFQRMT